MGRTSRWQTHNNTPLDIAQQAGHQDVVDFLSGRSATQATTKSGKKKKDKKNRGTR